MPAGPQHVTPAIVSDEHIVPLLPEDRLERGNDGIGRPAERAVGKFIERDEIDFAPNTAKQPAQADGVLRGIVFPAQQHVLERQVTVRRHGIRAARREEIGQGV